MSSAYQIYRSITIGLTLDETLHELLDRQIIIPRISQYILNVFDKIISQKLIIQSCKGKKESSLIFKGHLLSYRACDQVWTLVFDSLIFTSNTDPLWKINLIGQNNKIKIITCPTIQINSSNNQQLTTNQNDCYTKSKKFKSS